MSPQVGGCGSGNCQCAGLAQQVPASINGIALHEPGEHLPEEGDAFQYQLAIILDKLVMSAPGIKSEIRDSGIIDGGDQGFKLKEMEHLINILQAGSLPASLNPTPLQEEKVGPTLGEDTIAKGMRAIWISMLVVPIFMIFYYRFAGVVAVRLVRIHRRPFGRDLGFAGYAHRLLAGRREPEGHRHPRRGGREQLQAE